MKGVDLKRALEEKKLLQNLYRNSEMKLLTNKGFSLPLNIKITSYFGTKRIYNGVKKSQHSGMDFRAYIGQSVYSTNSGKVVLNKNLFFTGNTVIIDHGMNLFSVYGHLKASSLKLGENISSGDIIGLAGNTGRSTGPHLHWGVKFSGSNVSGDSLIIRSKNIFSKIRL